ncbi:hypothetical protein AKJ16_DCAP02111 [Drosera capensis]
MAPVVDGGDDLGSSLELSSSDSILHSSDDGKCIISSVRNKRRNFLDERQVDEAKRNTVGIAAAPVGFLAPIEGKHGGVMMENNWERGKGKVVVRRKNCKQFWKAGDFDEAEGAVMEGLVTRVPNGHARTNKSSMGNVISDTKGHTGNVSNINIESYKGFNDTSTLPECPSADGITRGDNGMEQALETVTKKEKVNEDEYTSNNRLTKRLRQVGGSSLQKAEQKLRDQVQESEKKIKEMDKEEETLIEVFSRGKGKTRRRGRQTEETMKVDELVEKVKRLEKMIPIFKTEKLLTDVFKSYHKPPRRVLTMADTVARNH